MLNTQLTLPHNGKIKIRKFRNK